MKQYLCGFCVCGTYYFFGECQMAHLVTGLSRFPGVALRNSRDVGLSKDRQVAGIRCEIISDDVIAACNKK